MRLEIDGEEAFAIDCDLLHEMSPDIDGEDGPGTLAHYGFISMSRNTDILIFRPPAPIKYNTNFKVQARADSGSSSRQLTRYWIAYTDES